jgi:hypothetical protein
LKVRAPNVGQKLPLELPGGLLKLAAREWLLSANGEVRFTPNTSRLNGRFRDILKVCY